MLERARSNRRNMTPAENRMWYYLRNRRLNNYKFVREEIIGDYVADFVCREKKLIIEIDGGQHSEKINYDNNRTKFFATQGYRVLRFWSFGVMKSMDNVLEAIINCLESMRRV